MLTRLSRPPPPQPAGPPARPSANIAARPRCGSGVRWICAGCSHIALGLTTHCGRNLPGSTRTVIAARSRPRRPTNRCMNRRDDRFGHRPGAGTGSRESGSAFFVTWTLAVGCACPGPPSVPVQWFPVRRRPTGDRCEVTRRRSGAPLRCGVWPSTRRRGGCTHPRAGRGQ